MQQTKQEDSLDNRMVRLHGDIQALLRFKILGKTQVFDLETSTLYFLSDLKEIYVNTILDLSEQTP